MKLIQYQSDNTILYIKSHDPMKNKYHEDIICLDAVRRMVMWDGILGLVAIVGMIVMTVLTMLYTIPGTLVTVTFVTLVMAFFSSRRKSSVMEFEDVE